MADCITVLVERCTMEIVLEPFFTQSTQANKKKLLRYVFQEPWCNEETIVVLGSYLAEKAEEAKELWRSSSEECQKGYFDADYCAKVFNLTNQQRHHIELGNRRRLAQVKRCKTKYVRCLKLLDYYRTIKTKSNL